MTETATPGFVHLRLHSEFSLADGMVRIDPLMQAVAEAGMPAVAVTDFCNLFAAVKFYRKGMASGIKPILGADLWLAPDTAGDPATLFTLLVIDANGYRNLIELITRAFLADRIGGLPCIRREWIEDSCDGLIWLSGAAAGEVGGQILSGRTEVASELLAWWQHRFPGRCYLELQRTGRSGDEVVVHGSVQLALKHNCPVVATNDVRFLEREQFEAHEARVCINQGRVLDDPRRPRDYSEEQYLKTPAEMAELFSDIPEALANTVEIARRCSLDLRLGEYFLPEYPVPDGETVESYFRAESLAGLERRLKRLREVGRADLDEAIYRERLGTELEIIIQMGFAGYFLIVMDFIRWAKRNGIPVGPGRGSGAGSLVAYSLDITDLDPIEYDLLFERFLNPERVSMPDFDVDFCMENRDRVIGYVTERYGREAVSQIVTFGTMAAKAVVRDVARVQGKSYGLADKLAKLIPFEIGMTLQKALEQEPQLPEFLAAEDEAQEIWEMALQLEGITRNCGKHAGGVVIAPTRLTDFAPLYRDESGGSVVTQFDKDDVEQAGLVKFDFLGLRTLTIIRWAVENVNRTRARQSQPPIEIDLLPLDDAETFALLQRGDTTAVFQLESRGMKDLIKKLQPSTFEDIVALVALFRPGPLQSGMVDDFIERKHGKAAIAYPHPDYQHEDLVPILEPTYGIILYQEQVMQIAQVLGGYTLGGADLLRRAMGKKKPEEMAKQREIFLEGATNRGVAADLAGNIFDLMEKFAGYGFNKSHSAAYALVAYQTAWLKAHYPAEFMAAVMSSDLQNTDKVVTFIDEVRHMGLSLVPPDVNDGYYGFTVGESGQIIYGLGAIKGLGEGPVEAIIAARKEAGRFTDLFDFCERVDLRRVNKRALEALIRAGALDRLVDDDDPGRARSLLLACVDEAVQSAEQKSSNESAGIDDMFGAFSDASAETGRADRYGDRRRQSFPLLSVRERLQGEKETLGLFLTGHPIDEYRDELVSLDAVRIADLEPGENAKIICGLVLQLRTIKTRRGIMAVALIDDGSARTEVTLFSDLFNSVRDIAVKDAVVYVEGVVEVDSFTGANRVRAESIKSLYVARQQRLRELCLCIDIDQAEADWSQHFHRLLTPFTGGTCPVRVRVRQNDHRGDLVLGTTWRVEPRDELLQQLRQEYGARNLLLQYR